MGWLNSLFGGTTGPADPPQSFFDDDGVPRIVQQRLADSKSGALPWVSTLSAPEMVLARSHGLRMIAPIAATCWMHYGFSWTEGHAQGWNQALRRLQSEAAALGANAVIDTRMVSVNIAVENSMDYSLVGTAVRIEGLPPGNPAIAPIAPIVSTVPALEFIQLLEAGIVPVGLAVGARFQWSDGPMDAGKGMGWGNNRPLTQTAAFWERIRRNAHSDLRADTARQGTGVLAHVQFSQLFMVEKPEPGRLLGRHIVIGTVVDCEEGATFPHSVEFVLDLSGKPGTLRAGSAHHDSYADGI